MLVSNDLVSFYLPVGSSKCYLFLPADQNMVPNYL